MRSHFMVLTIGDFRVCH